MQASCTMQDACTIIMHSASILHLICSLLSDCHDFPRTGGHLSLEGSLGAIANQKFKTSLEYIQSEYTKLTAWLISSRYGARALNPVFEDS